MSLCNKDTRHEGILHKIEGEVKMIRVGYEIWHGWRNQSKLTESKLKLGEFFLATVMQ